MHLSTSLCTFSICVDILLVRALCRSVSETSSIPVLRYVVLVGLFRVFVYERLNVCLRQFRQVLSTRSLQWDLGLEAVDPHLGNVVIVVLVDTVRSGVVRKRIRGTISSGCKYDGLASPRSQAVQLKCIDQVGIWPDGYENEKSGKIKKEHRCKRSRSGGFF
eukprot:CAMPEP_0197262694 /NCGR_PEP_ID=MMETSP1432-20130617/644_1 /TAXON_ID=44447 /ORGANISM="Pseudo-nitzschia delicatissima, Strain UNC1205" /LENGTH=161 /DNA_ID=CAMNT_0042727011 /DNA_START=18 /DNA_END=503 /DNA_ORIENTATION=-